MSTYDPDKATAREDLCRFLSACYYEPGPEFAEENLFESMQTAASRIDPDLADAARKLGEEFTAQDLQTLLVDYSRLFLGPMQALAQPYASCWLNAAETPDAEKMSPVLEMYYAGGFDIDEQFMELPDHIAVELEFLYALTFRKNDAGRLGDTDDMQAFTELERRFVSGHLGAWIGPFAAAVRSGAQTGFYRRLAELTERFVLLTEAGLGTMH